MSISLAITQAILAALLALRGSRLLAGYFAVSAFVAFDYAPQDAHWWRTHWLAMEILRMILRGAVTVRMLALLETECWLVGALVGIVSALLFRFVGPANDLGPALAWRATLLLMLFTALISADLVSRFGDLSSSWRYLCWSCTVATYAISAVLDIGPVRNSTHPALAWQRNTQIWSGGLLGIVLLWVAIEGNGWLRWHRGQRKKTPSATAG